MASGSRRMTEQEEEELRRELLQLRQEHRDLDAAIEDRLLPDIIA